MLSDSRSPSSTEQRGHANGNSRNCGTSVSLNTTARFCLRDLARVQCQGAAARRAAFSPYCFSQTCFCNRSFRARVSRYLILPRLAVSILLHFEGVCDPTTQRPYRSMDSFACEGPVAPSSINRVISEMYLVRESQRVIREILQPCDPRGSGAATTGKLAAKYSRSFSGLALIVNSLTTNGRIATSKPREVLRQIGVGPMPEHVDVLQPLRQAPSPYPCGQPARRTNPAAFAPTPQ